MRPAALAASLALCLTATTAVAKTIVVAPGPGTPLQDAIDAAAPGDRLKVQPGTYAEAITIDKPLVVLGNGATIDAGCAMEAAVSITADRVQLRAIGVRGGSTTGVTVSNADRVTLTVAVVPTCAGVQRAILADHTTRLLIKQSSTYAWDVGENNAANCASPLQQGERQFADADVVIATAPAAAGNRILFSSFCNPRTGIRITGAIGSAKGQPAVKVQRSSVNYANDGGITLQDADDVALFTNRVLAALPSGTTGIALDGTSDDNVVKGNQIDGFVQDVVDLGTSNCWRGNASTTGAVPSIGCP
jgi:nitrous oxidase accessory protein NosD